MQNKFRTLLVNDSPSSMKMMQNIVRHHRKLQAEFASGRDECLALFDSDAPFHIVICDLAASNEGAIEVIKAARAKSPDTKVVILTGFGDHQLIIDAIKAGVYAYVHKPFRPEEMNLVLINLTRHFEQRGRIDQLAEEIIDMENMSQQQVLRIDEMETELARLRRELTKYEPEHSVASDLNRAIARATAEKTKTTPNYNVFRELTNLTNLLEEKKITADEFQKFRRTVLEKAYQVPLA